MIGYDICLCIFCTYLLGVGLYYVSLSDCSKAFNPIIAYLSTLQRCPESFCPYFSSLLRKLEVDMLAA